MESYLLETAERKIFEVNNLLTWSPFPNQESYYQEDIAGPLRDLVSDGLKPKPVNYLIAHFTPDNAIPVWTLVHNVVSTPNRGGYRFTVLKSGKMYHTNYAWILLEDSEKSRIDLVKLEFLDLEISGLNRERRKHLNIMNTLAIRN